MSQLKWEFPDETTAVLEVPTSGPSPDPKPDEQKQTTAQEDGTSKYLKRDQPRDKDGFPAKFSDAVGQLLEEALDKAKSKSGAQKFTIQLQRMGEITSKDVEGIIRSVVCLLQQPAVETVEVPQNLYRPILGKCRAALIREVMNSLNLPEKVSVWGTELESREIIDTRSLCDKLKCAGTTETEQTTIRSLNDMSANEVLAGNVSPALSSAIVSAYKRLKKRRRSRHKERVKLQSFLVDQLMREEEKKSKKEAGKKKTQKKNPETDEDSDDNLDEEGDQSEPQPGTSTETDSKDAPPKTIYLTKYPKCYICKKRFVRHDLLEKEKAADGRHVYARLCPLCSETGNQKRAQTADLSGRYAVITGGRLKIGYELAVMMLRDGATVIVTTRFPHDATKRFAETPGFEDWGSRLLVYQLDLRDINGIYQFVDYVQNTFPHLDILVNNAAQTIRRPVQFYNHLLEYESRPSDQLPDLHKSMLAQPVNLFASRGLPKSLQAASTEGEEEEEELGHVQVYGKRKAGDESPEISEKKLAKVVEISEVDLDDDDAASADDDKTLRPSTPREDSAAGNDGDAPAAVAVSGSSSHTRPAANAVVLSRSMSDYFPAGRLDADGQQLDLRPTNSWREVLDDVPLTELMEALMVNTVAPFILNQQLKPAMAKSAHERRFIVNVSAMEGNFSRKSKTKFHPHTNMAKAAMNMMTRTAALGYADEGIYMTCVGTGWVTDERPHHQAVHEQETKGFTVPLDSVDGAARVYDPIVRGLGKDGEPLYAVFLKDYKVYPW